MTVAAWSIGLLVGSYVLLHYVFRLDQAKASFSAIGIMLAAMLPHFGFTKDTGSFFPIFTVVLCAVYALFALGLNIVVGFAGLLDLGYVAFFLFGAYTAAWMMSIFAVNVTPSWSDINIHFRDTANPDFPGIHITFWLVVIVAGVVAAIAGVIIGAPTLRLKSDYLALVTLGFGEILPEVFRNGDDLLGLNLTNGTKGIGPIDNVGMGPLALIPGVPNEIVSSDFQTKYYVILAFCLMFIWVSLKLRDGRLGRAWMAVREDELAASLMGVGLMKTKLWSYAIGAMAGGVGGAFYATIVGTVNVDNFTFQFSIIILCAVILGGMGNVWGAVLGGVVITWFNYTGLVWISDKLGINLKKYEFAFFGMVLVVMMLFRPQGFIPAARTKQVKQADKEMLAAQEVES
jgi:branched-chain amino acid transport system permease protein